MIKLTVVSSRLKNVLISYDKSTVIIGERINPTGRKKLSDKLKNNDFSLIINEAKAQIEEGAEIIDVNVGISGIDEKFLLPKVVKCLNEEIDIPLCIDSVNPEALEASLMVYKGKPLINSVNGEEKSFKAILPLVKEYRAAIIVMPMDEKGIPDNVEKRLSITEKIINYAVSIGIPVEDIIVDCIVLSVATQNNAGVLALNTIRGIKSEFGLNITAGASNISFGMPGRNLVNSSFLSAAIVAGLTCPVLNPKDMKRTVLATDMLLGRDKYGSQYIRNFKRDNQITKAGENVR